MNKSNQKLVKKILLTSLMAVAGFLLVIMIFLYGFGLDNLVVKKTASVLPFPAAFVGKTEIVATNQLEDRLISVKRFYENQNFSEIGLRIDFTTSDGVKRLKLKERNILNKLIEDRIIEKLAKERGIRITDDMISQEVNRKMDEYGSQEYLKENMQKLYGWTIEDFKKNIVKSDMYQEKLAKLIEEDQDANKQPKEKIQKAQKALESKKSFEEVVAEFSEGDSQKNAGELGWFSKDQLLTEMNSQIFSMEKGKNSDIIKSSLGYHIIQVEDKKNENGKEMVRIRQIFVRTKNFGDWLLEQEKNISIYIPLKEYYWDKNTSLVEFSDPELRDYANQIESKSSGDTSVIF